MELQLEDVLHQAQHVTHILEFLLHVLPFKNQIKFVQKQRDSAEHWSAQIKYLRPQQILQFLKEHIVKDSLIQVGILVRWVVELIVWHLQHLPAHLS